MKNVQVQEGFGTDNTALDLEDGGFDALLQKEFRPKTEDAKSAVQHAVTTLAQQALQNTITVSDDAYQTIEAIIAEIDRKLSDQINKIIHHEEFQKLEGAWLGLNHLVTNTESDDLLKIKVLPITKKEIARDIKRYKGVAWDQSPLFKRIYEEEYY